MATRTKRTGPAPRATDAPAAKHATSEVEIGPSAVFSGYDELAELGKENFGAFVRANAALSHGLEQIGKEVIVYARQSLESAAATTTALLSAKSLQDVIELNNGFARAALDRFLESSARLSEAGVKAASETLGPLSACAESAFTKFAKPLAL